MLEIIRAATIRKRDFVVAIENVGTNRIYGIERTTLPGAYRHHKRKIGRILLFLVVGAFQGAVRRRGRPPKNPTAALLTTLTSPPSDSRLRPIVCGTEKGAVAEDESVLGEAKEARGEITVASRRANTGNARLFTKREREILHYAAENLATKQIGENWASHLEQSSITNGV
jgi:hypothetical protein